jgi:hypothetical protein
MRGEPPLQVCVVFAALRLSDGATFQEQAGTSSHRRRMCEGSRTLWPHEKRFAFTVFDDTDNDVISNTIAVYDLLAECNMRTSKSVWIYPPRDGFRGLGLLDSDYEQYIMGLCAKGFEICLHNVGSGSFSRKEITYGLA